ncbi:hypothetical protein E4U54_006241 [Claviceps lovelessii]|nr:hypothetical protein E4U54_006241 [Claviceps lovelessii]
MTTKGSCLCGEVGMEYTGEPAATALCHCLDCQKVPKPRPWTSWTGSAYTANAVVPRQAFKVTRGSPKAWDATGASGKVNKHFFCGTCGSSLYTALEIMPDVYCVKAGTLDGGAASLGDKIGVEFYTKDRVGYLGGVEGAKQEPVFG